jgi:hypothetical protein
LQADSPGINQSIPRNCVRILKKVIVTQVREYLEPDHDYVVFTSTYQLIIVSFCCIFHCFYNSLWFFFSGQISSVQKFWQSLRGKERDGITVNKVTPRKRLFKRKSQKIRGRGSNSY